MTLFFFLLFYIIGVNIFSRHPPQDPDSKALPFLDTTRPACVASGRPLIGTENTMTCRVCSHKMFSREVRTNNCPLCHAKLQIKQERLLTMVQKGK